MYMLFAAAWTLHFCSTKSEVGGVMPKVSPYREINVAAAVRDVSCVTCRACDVARDRSMGRESGEENRRSVGKEILLKFLRFFSSAMRRYLAKCY